ncbi:MAG: selenide, water dikinase SelD [Cyclobacteriaceae bacterium]|jgi:selenide,water dikinase|nr:selenide, water dikinase SelD [Cyclobacteriaceae bacterium]
MSIQLTHFSHGAGCGCKIAPAVLDKILQSATTAPHFPALLVGHESKDDAAVYALGNGTCLISTTDFFMPIVDDAFTFGAIASANALSDVYAMGGSPLLAIAILGWPVEKIPVEVAQQVLEGARSICAQANIPLAGGHSIDSPEPIFGLAVTGRVNEEHLKRNNTAQPGDVLYLTKPLGTGLITTAQKRGLAREADVAEAVRLMQTLNHIGSALGALPYVHALTDITGFGLLGHLWEMCEGSGLSAEIDYPRIPLIAGVTHYTQQFIYPDNTMRNWQRYEPHVQGIGSESLLTLCDPQTSGGLLVAIAADEGHAFEDFLTEQNVNFSKFGHLMAEKPCRITIVNSR